MDVISLLKSKNRCLEKFIEISIQFFNETQTGDFSQLDRFESQRSATLKAFDLLQRKVHESTDALKEIRNNATLAIALQQEMAIKARLIQKILELDEKIILALNVEKSRVQIDLNSSHKNKETVMKFKSTWMPESGEGIDEKL
ncbi:MAG: flagellar protein FliT [Bdellovibrionota bacterium]